MGFQPAEVMFLALRPWTQGAKRPCGGRAEPQNSGEELS